jgi:hypothetical protein
VSWRRATSTHQANAELTSCSDCSLCSCSRRRFSAPTALAYSFCTMEQVGDVACGNESGLCERFAAKSNCAPLTRRCTARAGLAPALPAMPPAESRSQTLLKLWAQSFCFVCEHCVVRGLAALGGFHPSRLRRIHSAEDLLVPERPATDQICNSRARTNCQCLCS